MRYLVEAIKRLIKKASNTQKRVIHENSKWYSLRQALIDNEASQPQLKIVHLIISGFHFIWVKNVIQIGIYWSSPSLKLDFTLPIGVMTWNLCDYPLLQQSKGIIVMCMIISSLTSMLLVHIVHAS